MREPRILGSWDVSSSRLPILQSYEPAHGGVPQVEAAVPERDLSLECFVGLPQPGTLELSKGSQGRGEIIVQGDVCWIGRARLQEDGGGLARFLNQPGHVVGEALGIPDLKTEGPRRLELLLAHPEPSRYWLTAYPGVRSRLTIPQANGAEY